MQVITVPNIMQPEKSFKTDHEHTSVIEYLQFQYPDGFKVPHVIYRNNKMLEVEDYDIACGRDDFIVIAFSPGIATAALAGWQLFAAYAANFAISAAASYVIGEIFKPNIPRGVLTSDQKTDAANVSSVYNLSSGQNKVSLGQPIPSLYGRTRVYPSLVEKPYFRFDNNDMYLYQMMAISVGDMIIDELLVSDTPEDDLSPNDIVSRTFKETDFINGGIEGSIASLFNDNNYHMRVKTLPEINGLELRGTPSDSTMYGSFSGNIITFNAYDNGQYPDLSSLSNGSAVIISNSDSNDGTYEVDSVDDSNHTITVKSHTFTTEPIIQTINSTAVYDEGDLPPIFSDGISENSSIDRDIYDNAIIGRRYKIEFEGKTYYRKLTISKIAGILGKLTTYFSGGSGGSMSSSYSDIAVSLTYEESEFTAKFETSYGAYTLDDTPSTLDSVEIDVEYPRGIYNSDTSGNFTDRTILLEYKLIGSHETLWIDLNDNDETWTEQEKTNTPQRRTYSLPIPSGLTDDVPLKIRLRRSSPEIADIKSQDEAVVTRIKSIYNEPDISGYGDITLLWCRIKATNAISSAGQFQINAWATRADVESDIKSVITDLYTNTDYGAGLSLSDLDLPTTTEVFNGAIDSKITVMDALRMVGKAGRYNVYLDGQNVTMRKDDIQLIRTALFNETNILKDTFKLDYLFGEDDGYDGISVKYRDPINFKESIATYPSGAINPEVTELIGCTDFDIALKEATYGWLQKESRRKVATFSTDIQGIIPNYLDRIGITHNVPEWGQSSQIVEVSGNQITINCQLFYFSDEIGSCDDEFGACDDIFCIKVPENIDYNTIIFRKNDGSVSDLYALTIIDESTILLDEAPPAWLYTGYDYDNTFFSIGVSTKFIKDYIVTEIQPRGNNVIDVKCINYDETVYDAPYLVDGEGANLTDGAGNYLTQ